MYFQSGPVGSFTYPNYLNFKVPVSLTGHSFALKYQSGGSPVTSAASVAGIITRAERPRRSAGGTLPRGHRAIAADFAVSRDGGLVSGGYDRTTGTLRRTPDL